MTNSNPAADWIASRNAAIGTNVARWRKRRELTHEQLGKRCGEHGFPMTADKIRKVENGTARAAGGLSIHEIEVLALALCVSEIQLRWDLEGNEKIEVSPGVWRSPWEAALWSRGDVPLLESEKDEWAEATIIVRLHQRHAGCIATIYTQRDMARRAASQHRMFGQVDWGAGMTAPEQYQRNIADFSIVERGYLAELKGIRAEMRAEDVTPPELPPDIAYPLEGHTGGFEQ